MSDFPTRVANSSTRFCKVGLWPALTVHRPFQHPFIQKKTTYQPTRQNPAREPATVEAGDESCDMCSRTDFSRFRYDTPQRHPRTAKPPELIAGWPRKSCKTCTAMHQLASYRKIPLRRHPCPPRPRLIAATSRKSPKPAHPCTNWLRIAKPPWPPQIRHSPP